MNAFNKLLLAVFTLATALTSCNSWIYDTPEDCPQGVYLKYYAQSTCGDTITSFYDDFGRSASLTIFAFNQEDKLVSYRQVNKVDLTKDYHYLYPISNGRYYFRTWVNATKADLKANNFEPGITTANDLGFAMRQTMSGELLNIDTAMHIWQGRSDSVIVLPDPQEINTEWYDTVATSLVDQTKKIRVTLEGLPKDTLKAMQVYLELGNHAKNIDASPMYRYGRGHLIPNYRYFEGDSIDNDSTEVLGDSIVVAPSTASYDFKTLTLYGNTVDQLVITNPAGKVVFKEPVVAAILRLLRYQNKHEVAIECDYNFHIRLRFRTKDFMSVDLMLGSWVVHSYETHLRM